MTVTAPERPPIAANLRRLKRASGLTWTEIVRRTGIDHRQLMEYQRDGGRYQPGWENLCKLAAVFDVEPHVFYVPPES